MLNSPNINDSPRSNKHNLHGILNETANGIPRSFLQPKITSTPLVRRESVFATPPKPHLLSPRRYSLSEIVTSPRTNRRDLSKVHATGPLLASTRYNLNVSTYEDTKSPGLAGRIVQYNEETQKEKQHQRLPTHQAKYGSPGIFPVVHLFKKKLPPLEQKPRTVTVRIASPEFAKQHSQEYNRILMEGIVKTNSPSANRRVFSSPSGEGSSSGTRSVLEALKEISRKRIHASEEYELNEDNGKRIRTEILNEADSNKRLRDESPLLDSPSPNKSNTKRICMYDEYAASCSSMNYSFKNSDQPSLKRKSISISTLTESPKELEQVKLINAETQTVPDEVNKSMNLNETPIGKQIETNGNDTDSDKQIKKKESPIQIFDDAPLERIRKNRLAALMGSLTGKDPVLTPKPDYASKLYSDSDAELDDTSKSQVSKISDKPLISILSSPKKDSPQRSNKHVHFSIPESTSQPNITTSPISSFPITHSSASITSPISSTYEAKSSLGSNKSEQKRQIPAPPSSPVGLTPTSSVTTMAMSVPAFGSGSNSSSVTSVVSKESSSSLLTADMSKSDTAVPKFQFQLSTASGMALGTTTSAVFSSSPSVNQPSFISPVVSTPSSVASPPKMGGFKFDLNKPAATSAPAPTSDNLTVVKTTANSLPIFSFTAPPPVQTDANKDKPIFGKVNISSSTNVQPSSGSAPTGLFFGGKSTTSGFPSVTTITTTGISSGNAFGTTTTSSSSFVVPASNISALPTFKFGSANAENTPIVASFGSPTPGGLNLVSTNVSSSVPAFGTNTFAPVMSSTLTTSTLSFGTSKAPIFSFGSTTTTPIAGSFGVTTTKPATFDSTPLTTSASSGFGAPSTGSFAAPNPQPSNNFGVATSASTLGFGMPSTTVSGGFGTSSTTPMFGTNKLASPFGTTTTNATVPFATSSISSSQPSPFGKSTLPAFGQTTTQPSFGVPTTTISFGTATTFGGTTTASSSVFGVPNSSSSTFGKSSGTGSIFGAVANTKASSFGTTTSKPLFGGATPLPFGNPAPVTTAPAFGNTSTPTFNFGAKTTASNSFGGPFGNTTTASTGFGTSTTPAFGTSNTFGNNSSNFGTSNAFGGSSTAAFAAPTTTSQPASFGSSTNTTPAFGNSNPGFGASSNKAPMFGSSTTPAFGSTPTPSFGTSTPTPGFGAPNNASAFGTNTAASAFAKPQTEFGSTSNNTFGTGGSFGTNQLPTSGFGAPNPPNTQAPMFNFGATAAPKPAGVFSFGAPSLGEPLKPSFNFTGGSSTPAFGSSGAPSFGSAAPPAFGNPVVPQFNAPQPAAAGMFSIGSGSTSGRTRTQLRAKRRT